MKRSTTLVAGGLTAGAVLALLAPVVAGSAGADAGVRLRLVERGTAFHVIDVPAPAADGQAGDLATFESDLLKAGKKVGTLEGSCLQIRANGTLDDCSVTVTVGRNSYRMAGPFDPATGGTLTIVGGTGAWVGAGGTDTIVNRPDGTAVHTVSIRL
ncbi:MAG: hypothetical protein HY830_28050 [Actinobacteria bacterium]|nr:hypothetical protein [Actinomycetota bacterium]